MTKSTFIVRLLRVLALAPLTVALSVPHHNKERAECHSHTGYITYTEPQLSSTTTFYLDTGTSWDSIDSSLTFFSRVFPSRVYDAGIFRFNDCQDGLVDILCVVRNAKQTMR